MVVCSSLWALGCEAQQQTACELDTFGNDRHGVAEIETITMDCLPPSLDECSSCACSGPHGGTLVELGRQRFHGELVIQDELVTVYLLDSVAEEAQFIDSPTISLNLLVNGKPQQFLLTANANSSPTNSGNSRFERLDSELAQLLRSGKIEAKLAIRIAGVAYHGPISTLTR